jgi:nucleoside-diphosphate-sugar epimerase
MDTPTEVTGPINLGNPVEFTIRELAELVIEMTGRSRSWCSARCRRTTRCSASPTSDVICVVDPDGPVAEW